MTIKPKPLKEVIKSMISSGRVKAELIEHKNLDATTSLKAALIHKLPINQIIKVLAFIDSGGKIAIVIIQGNKKVDIKKIPNLNKPKLVTLAELKQWLKVTPGGIPPIALPANIPKFVDIGVLKQKIVIGSAGDPYTGLKIEPKIITDQPNTSILDLAL